MELKLKLQVFEGPLDLLLHLIDKNKVNIYDIPIVEITDQYMQYIDEIKKNDLNIMSEFLLMAATLLSIKSKMLLPKEVMEDIEEEEDPRAQLVQQLLEYKMYKSMAYELRDRQVDASQVYFKGKTLPKEVEAYETPLDVEELMMDITLSQLNQVFQSVIRRQKFRVDPIRSKFCEIKQEEISLEEKMNDLSDYVLTHQTFSFRELLEKQATKTEIIVTFLAVLEFMKAGKIIIAQKKIFDDIVIQSKLAA